MKPIYLLALLCLLLSSCQNTYEFWNISKFNMDANALEDEEPIKVLYTSRAPDNNKDLEYYIHLVVVSQKTGDTVNLLTTANNGFTEEDIDKVFNYFGPENIVTKASQIDIEELKNMEPRRIDQMKLQKINKVVRDPKFDYIADNDYPTVIGTVGTVTEKEEK